MNNLEGLIKYQEQIIALNKHEINQHRLRFKQKISKAITSPKAYITAFLFGFSLAPKKASQRKLAHLGHFLQRKSKNLLSDFFTQAIASLITVIFKR